jgi:pimeloyl-ACP methyl ester carboxylesterase
VEPFYFGVGEPLFGIYHPPSGRTWRDVGVLLCSPIGHEYIACHRSYRQLAMRLADAGFHVMRFDYHACGDSAGDCEDGHPERWLRDISAAIGTLRLRAGRSRVTLVGCRLGATLATLVGAARGDVEHLVLWDPVADGRSYIDELTNRHREMLRRSHLRVPSTADGGDRREFLGFAMGAAAIDAIRALDLLGLQRAPAGHLLVMVTESQDLTGALRAHLQALGGRVSHEHVPTRNAWSWIEDMSAVPVPHTVLTRIVSWLCKAHA